MDQIERIAGESDEAASALALWSQGLTIDQIATRLNRPKVKILAYKQDYRWDERCARGGALPVGPSAPPQPAAPSPAQILASVAPLQPVEQPDEIAATIARFERAQEGLKALQQAQFALGLEIVHKLTGAVRRLDVAIIKPRDIGPLLAAATRATDSAWNNLANIEGVNAFLDAAVKAQRATTQDTPDDDEDGDE